MELKSKKNYNINKSKYKFNNWKQDNKMKKDNSYNYKNNYNYYANKPKGKLYVESRVDKLSKVAYLKMKREECLRLRSELEYKMYKLTVTKLYKNVEKGALIDAKDFVSYTLSKSSLFDSLGKNDLVLLKKIKNIFQVSIEVLDNEEKKFK